MDTVVLNNTNIFAVMNRNYLEKFDTYIFLVWISIWLILAIQFSYNASIQETISLSLAVILVFYPFTAYLSKVLLKKAIKEKKVLKFAVQFIFISLFMSILVLGIYSIFNYLEKSGVFPVSELFSDKNTNLNDTLGAFTAAILINFGFCGLRFFEENLKLHKVIIDSQLQALKAQINPHFMFNVLNHVNILIKKDPDMASDLLVQYTGILRYQLYTGEKDLISIRQEINFLKDFIEIEKVRWKNNLMVTCSWETEDDETQFPPLLLITFIENAFKHVSRSKTEKGYVTLSLKQKGKEIRMQVENSKFSDEFNGAKKERSGLGLNNIKRRLDILYPGKYNLDIHQTDTLYSTTLKINL